MTHRTPTEAYFQFIEPIQRALNYVTVGRLLLGRPAIGPGAEHFVDTSFNGGDPSPMTRSDGTRVFLRVGFRCRIDQESHLPHSYRCRLVAYSCVLLDNDHREILAFHWNSMAVRTERPFPHLHLGRAVSGRNDFLPERFHKIHVPTGIVTIPSLVRFAIEELGVDVRSGMNAAEIPSELARSIESE